GISTGATGREQHGHQGNAEDQMEWFALTNEFYHGICPSTLHCANIVHVRILTRGMSLAACSAAHLIASSSSLIVCLAKLVLHFLLYSFPAQPDTLLPLT